MMMRRHEIAAPVGASGISGALARPSRGLYSARRRGVAPVVIVAFAVLLLSLAAVLGAGCSSEQAESSGPLTIDLAEGQASGLSTDMGASPAGKTEFTLSPEREAVESYQEEAGSDAGTADMLEDWVDSITMVTLDGRELSESPFNKWKDELESPEDDYDRLLYYDFVANEEDVTLTLPAGLFNDFDDDGVSEKHLIVEAEGYDDVSGDVRFRKSELDQLVVRSLDKSAELGGIVQSECDLSLDDLKSLPVQTSYESSANCGMAGLRSCYAEGVYLTDILEAAGVEFGPGMTVQLRTEDAASTNSEDDPSYYSSGAFTYEELLGTLRYHYPAMWDDETTYDELGGATVYELLAADINAWKGDDEQSKTLARIIGETKVEVSPLISWESNGGVVGWGGVNPALQSFGPYKINPYSEYSGYSFNFGLMANEDGSVADEATTMRSAGMVIGIDVFPTPEAG